MKAVYFATRTLARNAVEELNGKFKDFGTDAPKGERWAVLVEETVQNDQTSVQEDSNTSQVTPVQQITESLIDYSEAIAVLNRPGSVIGEQTLRTPNNKPVRTLWRRNKTAMRLAAHMEATA